MASDLFAWIFEQCAVDENGCWIWQRSLNNVGYGRVRIDGREQHVHRLMFKLARGPIPKGKEIDHVYARGCRSRACCNPAHLEAVTRSENQRRGKQGRREACPQGHPYDGLNTYLTPKGHRRCRECHRQQQHRRKRA